jgi:hypothetical protein
MIVKIGYYYLVDLVLKSNDGFAALKMIWHVSVHKNIFEHYLLRLCSWLGIISMFGTFHSPSFLYQKTCAGSKLLWPSSV